MITGTKMYTKEEKRNRRQNPRQMVKAKLYRPNHTKKHAHTHSQREEKEKKKKISI